MSVAIHRGSVGCGGWVVVGPELSEDEDVEEERFRFLCFLDLESRFFLCLSLEDDLSLEDLFLEEDLCLREDLCFFRFGRFRFRFGIGFLEVRVW